MGNTSNHVIVQVPFPCYKRRHKSTESAKYDFSKWRKTWKVFGNGRSSVYLKEQSPPQTGPSSFVPALFPVSSHDNIFTFRGSSDHLRYSKATDVL